MDRPQVARIFKSGVTKNKLHCCMVTPKIKGKSMPLSAIMHTVSLHRHIMAYCQFTQSDNGILSVYTATD